MSPRYFALIPAAGVGARMGSGVPKQYMKLAGKPMLRHVLDTFAAHPSITHTFVVVGPEDGYIADVVDSVDPGALTVLRCGGIMRQQSVLNGLAAMRRHCADEDWVLVHDAARPGLSLDLVDALIRALSNDPVGGLLAIPVADTLKRGNAAGRVETTLERDGLWAAQTPQMFRYGLLRRALDIAAAVTDESGAVEGLGLQPRLIMGHPRNFKVTLTADIELAELYLKGKP
jgi:2-C-methyl-D-erythritol 4-phosphate cytidylyltransferase